MIFEDRTDAGHQLAELLSKDEYLKRHRHNVLVLSLIRGGAPVGFELAKKLDCFNRPLIVKKIGAPGQEELAIGAICGSQVFLDSNLIKRLALTTEEVEAQINKSRLKEKEYWKKFNKRKYWLKNRVVIISDDGVATGASVTVTAKFLRVKKVNKIYLAVPVVPDDFPSHEVKKLYDKIFVLHKVPDFNAVSQYYKHFDQISDKETMKYF
ncbi:hypothetical protein A3C23_02045 [Candidatus Roizmanbacteria bacterium RIFCSPHIGHO2_02_FULL_37_13b]|uniref:Phosphoribosyltransferase domain-containing protein n=1 Tax=Candidatus Roizmanbacteria bacterium RIFCSPLOWO2_02_FULL_36_11 TaxID=1802071 RepID=A0A1F7JBQ0_9BACT|nr:MAG: hypothetical protein A3C23_02045 [Candidatus Roizmanbacteria bacterium RIFCSPHIGHO2_02_FULL_37_13b]OGK53030.1 MAG: hypothetical protein A3H78_02365 [Candidatus Roizmanbacteria bacterium RIFCSPLOWO2_02_FULL_36_11]